jgi:hypothetical protein
VIQRIWHNYEKWEDFASGMYRNRIEKEYVNLSLDLLSNPYRLFTAMAKVTAEWVFCSEHNLSNLSQNRKAWLGWASCAMRHGSTDEETRQAWNLLNSEQKALANLAAQLTIEAWEKIYYGANYAKNTAGDECIGGSERKD